MAKIPGKNSAIYIRHYDISGDGNRVALTISPDTFETTGFQEKGKTYVEGKYDWSLAVDGFWNSAANQSDPALKEMVGIGTQVVSFFPGGTAISSIGYQGYGILKTYNPESTIAGAVVFSADIQGCDRLHRQNVMTVGYGTGTVTGTYLNLGTITPAGTIIFCGVALPSSRGTVTLNYYASTSPTGAAGVGLVSTFTMVNTGVNVTSIGTAINAGPYWRGDITVPITDDFTLVSTGAISS